jgi:hypothetical protein
VIGAFIGEENDRRTVLADESTSGIAGISNVDLPPAFLEVSFEHRGARPAAEAEHHAVARALCVLFVAIERSNGLPSRNHRLLIHASSP